MTVILLNYFTSYPKASNDINPFTGSSEITTIADSAVVVIPINILRQANIKLTERVYLKNYIEKQDSIINNYKVLNDRSERELDNLLRELETSEKLRKSIAHDNKKWKAVGLTSIVLTLFTIATVIIAK